jgi:hypothetical protein
MNHLLHHSISYDTSSPSPQTPHQSQVSPSNTCTRSFHQNPPNRPHCRLHLSTADSQLISISIAIPIANPHFHASHSSVRPSPFQFSILIVHFNRRLTDRPPSGRPPNKSPFPLSLSLSHSQCQAPSPLHLIILYR